jgi:dipicolinate synthase subunit A
MGVIIMVPYKTYAVIGGDLRQAHIANRIAAEGNTVYPLLLEENPTLLRELICEEPLETVLPRCDVVILPLPLSVDDSNINAPFSKRKLSLKHCFESIKPGTAIFAGKVDAAAKLAKKYGHSITDYLEREELAIKNAAITAEAAVAIAVEEQPVALFGSHCLIVGHGRIARSLMRILNGMSASVAVAARKYGDLAQIQAEGCEPIPFGELKRYLHDADIVFNTVPAKVLNREELSLIRSTTLLIDLASRPGGIDLDAAGELGVKTIWALSLPGKTSPISAGEFIWETVENCLRERGDA